MPPKRVKVSLLSACTIPVIAVGAQTSSSTSCGFDLGADITNFIPSCALGCFESFLEVNFNNTVCGLSPSLQCLCSHTGSTGYTIGEGAFQCIVAENRVGACESMDVGSATASSAYYMCYDVPEAAPETHDTMIATLIVPPTGPIVVPNPLTTAKNNKGRTTYYTHPAATTAAPTLSVTPAAAFISSLSTSSRSSSTSPTPTSATPVLTTTSAVSSKLSAAQIVGIAVGSVAVVVIILVGIFFLVRRRRGRSVDGFFRVRDSWSSRRKGTPETSAPEYRENTPMSFTRAPHQGAARTSEARCGVQEDAIRPYEAELVAANVTPSGGQGTSPSPPPLLPLSALPTQANLTLFPKQGDEFPKQRDDPKQRDQPARHQQKEGSQPKPRLRVTIPPTGAKYSKGSSSRSNDDQMPYNGDRDSVVTEFAEDGETSAGAGSAQIWRPPNTDSRYANMYYYVADKWGNWVLRGFARPDHEQHVSETATAMSKTAAGRDAEQDQAKQKSGAAEALTWPTLGLLETWVRADKPSIRHVPVESGRLPINTRSGSLHSNFSLLQAVPLGTENSVANATSTRRKGPSRMQDWHGVGAGAGNSTQVGRDDMAGQPVGSGGMVGVGAAKDRPNSMMSQDSATTIASSVASEVGTGSSAGPSHQPSAHGLQQRQRKNLSPVMESPGRSPVSYPRIPRAQSQAVEERMAVVNGGRPAREQLQHPALVVKAAAQGSYSAFPAALSLHRPIQRGSSSAQAGEVSSCCYNYYSPPKKRNPHPNRDPGQVRTGSPDVRTTFGQTQTQTQQQQQ